MGVPPPDKETASTAPAGERLIHEILRRNPALADRLRRGSQGAAIRAFCLECTGGERAEVARCTALDCPLFDFRLTGRWLRRPKLTAEQSAKLAAQLRPAAKFEPENASEAPDPEGLAPGAPDAASDRVSCAAEVCADSHSSSAVRR